MLIANNKNTAIGKYDEFSTNLLIGESNSGSKEISIQVTDVEPKGMQFLHSHEEEQCYYQAVSGDCWGMPQFPRFTRQPLNSTLFC